MDTFNAEKKSRLRLWTNAVSTELLTRLRLTTRIRVHNEKDRVRSLTLRIQKIKNNGEELNTCASKHIKVNASSVINLPLSTSILHGPDDVIGKYCLRRSHIPFIYSTHSCTSLVFVFSLPSFSKLEEGIGIVGRRWKCFFKILLFLQTNFL